MGHSNFSIGAEFYVMSKLLLNNIPTFKSYTNQEGFDLICINSVSNISVTIQVKSNSSINDYSFWLNKRTNIKPDFYIFLNTKIVHGKGKAKSFVFTNEPEIFIFPIRIIKRNRRHRVDNKKNHYFLLSDKNYRKKYQNNFDQIKDVLGL